MSYHFFLRRKQDYNNDGDTSSEPKTTRKEYEKRLIEEDKHENKTYLCYRNFI